MELQIKDICTEFELITSKKFMETYDISLTHQGINYNIRKQKLDYVIISDHRFIVLNDKAKEFIEKFKNKV